MDFLSQAYGFLRFASGLRRFLDETVSVEAAKATIQRNMQLREAALLEVVEGKVFANPESPYLKLFRAAGCELGDVKTLVRKEGCDGALHTLHRNGIYVTFEEFKGRAPAVRGSQTFTFRDSDFDNPLITPHYYSSSGGTGGRPTRVKIDLDHIAQSAPPWAIWFAAHGLLGRPLVFWTSTHSGIASSMLRLAKFGQKTVKWFATAGMDTVTGRLITSCVHGMARRAGGFPKPEIVPLPEAGKIGDYVARMVSDGIKPCVNTTASGAARISLAMQERGMSLRDVTFLLRGEALTLARRQTIEASGARAVQTYGFSEGGPVGSQCPTPAAVDDVHVFLDAFAVIQRAISLTDGANADSLLLTALRPAAPKVMLNAEIGDYAVLETRKCGCLFDELGYCQHLHNVRSFEKLTGEGVTIAGADLFHLMEEVLPRRFGGALTDYQLVEEQDAKGLARYILRVSPELGPLDEPMLVATFLKELAKLKVQYRLMSRLWAETNILRVERKAPLVSARGKVLPFRTLGLR